MCKDVFTICSTKAYTFHLQFAKSDLFYSECRVDCFVIEVVLTVPKQVRGLHGPLISDLEPVLIVGLGCEAWVSFLFGSRVWAP